VGGILSAFIDGTQWMPRIHTRAEDISFAGMMIDRGWVTVAEVGGVVGFLARDAAEIHALYVAPGARGKGCGSALLNDAQARRCELSLWTFQANTRAQAFYACHGFAEVGRSNGARNDENLPDIRMIWHAREAL
jgi:ribosomal protein S18 acetylase RimI-like enzyme